MARAKKIAITVDAELFARAERLRRQTEESRSALFARALRVVLQDEERKRKIAEYVAGYERVPENLDEMRWAIHASIESLRDLLWEDE